MSGRATRKPIVSIVNEYGGSLGAKMVNLTFLSRGSPLQRCAWPALPNSSRQSNVNAIFMSLLRRVGRGHQFIGRYVDRTQPLLHNFVALFSCELRRIPPAAVQHLRSRSTAPPLRMWLEIQCCASWHNPSASGCYADQNAAPSVYLVGFAFVNAGAICRLLLGICGAERNSTSASLVAFDHATPAVEWAKGQGSKASTAGEQAAPSFPLLLDLRL